MAWLCACKSVTEQGPFRKAWENKLLLHAHPASSERDLSAKKFHANNNIMENLVDCVIVCWLFFTHKKEASESCCSGKFYFDCFCARDWLLAVATLLEKLTIDIQNGKRILDKPKWQLLIKLLVLSIQKLNLLNKCSWWMFLLMEYVVSDSRLL